MKKSIIIFLMVIIFLGSSGLAQVASGKSQFIVTSSRQEIDYKNRIFTYSGNVKAQWGEISLEAETLEVYITTENVLQRIVGKGKVKLVQQGRKATCQLFTYTFQEDKTVLEGNVNYTDQLGNTLIADKVTIWEKGEKLEAEGSPVKATYILEEGKNVSPSGKKSK